MARQEQIVIQSRLGEQIVDSSKIIYFPRGIIGFEDMHEFTLLQIRENVPMLILQSMDDPTLGLLVADPYSFLPDYSLKVGDAEQKLLCLESPLDVTVLVTVSIPHGKPHLTCLNLTGPILVNANKKYGLQVPQADQKPSHIMLENIIKDNARILAEKNAENAEKAIQAEVEKAKREESLAANVNLSSQTSLEEKDTSSPSVLTKEAAQKFRRTKAVSEPDTAKIQDTSSEQALDAEKNTPEVIEPSTKSSVTVAEESAPPSVETVEEAIAEVSEKQSAEKKNDFLAPSSEKSDLDLSPFLANSSVSLVEVGIQEGCDSAFPKKKTKKRTARTKQVKAEEN